jgi:hypothetical protein
MMLRVLLLDLDEVLIKQVAYHQSLKECVERVGRWCGFESVRLTDEDIALFESLGVTSEWDSSAMCAALLLDRAWSVDPECQLPASPSAPNGRLHELPVPDFQSFFQSMLDRGVSGIEARRLTEQRLLEDKEHTLAQRHALQTMLRDAYDTERSLTNRMIQELNLGTTEFEACYGRPAAIPGEGLLRTKDLPLISAGEAAQLVQWDATPGKRAVVFTNRLSRVPPGIGGAPEAEIGLACLGLSALPFVSMGHLDWACAQRGLEPQSLLKPSPVHALAALRLAAGDTINDALSAATALELDHRDVDGWQRLDQAQATVFEDSFRGLQSARGAQQSLDRIGVRLSVDLRGVTTRDVKRRALEVAGGVVYPDFTSAARDILTGSG